MEGQVEDGQLNRSRARVSSICSRVSKANPNLASEKGVDEGGKDENNAVGLAVKTTRVQSCLQNVQSVRLLMMVTW